MWFQIFHTGVTPIPTKVCFPLQVLFSGLLDSVETTQPFTETPLTSNGRSLNKGDKDGLGGSKTQKKKCLYLITSILPTMLQLSPEQGETSVGGMGRAQAYETVAAH